MVADRPEKAQFWETPQPPPPPPPHPHPHPPDPPPNPTTVPLRHTCAAVGLELAGYLVRLHGVLGRIDVIFGGPAG